MSLYIRSKEVNDKANQLAMLTGKSKSDAVGKALAEAIERARQQPTKQDLIKALQSSVNAFLEGDS